MEDASPVKKTKLSESSFLKKATSADTGSERESPTRTDTIDISSSDVSTSDEEENVGMQFVRAIIRATTIEWLDLNGSAIIGQLLAAKPTTKRARK